MFAEFIHKHTPAAAWIQFYGEYPSEELQEVLIAVGWQREERPLPVIPPKYVDENTETGRMVQPRGKGLFGAPLPEEGKPRIVAACEVFRQFNIPFRSKPRKQTLEEAL